MKCYNDKCPEKYYQRAEENNCGVLCGDDTERLCKHYQAEPTKPEVLPDVKWEEGWTIMQLQQEHDELRKAINALIKGV